MRRIAEEEIDTILAQAFLQSKDFCDIVRDSLGIIGEGAAERVVRQTKHAEDGGTIDLDVILSGCRLLIENKIQAAWSHTAEGLPQPERYRSSAARLDARAVLFAPQAYLAAAVKRAAFADNLSYERLLRGLRGEDRALLEAAIAQAEIPPANPDEARTRFYEAFERCMGQVAPRLVMKRRPRNRDSYTVHLDVAKSLKLHSGLPTPSVYLQLRQTGAKLFIRKWGWHLDRIEAQGGLEGTPIRFGKVGRRGTLVLELATPFVNCEVAFEEVRDEAVAAIRATEWLCAWWDANPRMLQCWQDALP